MDRIFITLVVFLMNNKKKTEKYLYGEIHSISLQLHSCSLYIKKPAPTYKPQTCPMCS